VAGRAGRGEEPGEVLVQTYHPDHYAIRAAILGDDEGFYQEEFAVRESFGYPPFRRLMRLLYWGPREDPVRAAAEEDAERNRIGFDDPLEVDVRSPARTTMEPSRRGLR